ncbi:hypothetical protein IE53DRAFT_390731 [Violaceomyces palustris]|uniref:Uncharacterized protein n=1 Tax=Violaceomyces palustris TaxID=1673888 RepID=A0ACD0NMV2_9BASI|nr:hypothetical protein IE53DRAFT_390731 [Violaceomyces palustris]
MSRPTLIHLCSIQHALQSISHPKPSILLGPSQIARRNKRLSYCVRHGHTNTKVPPTDPLKRRVRLDSIKSSRNPHPHLLSSDPSPHYSQFARDFSSRPPSSPPFSAAHHYWQYHQSSDLLPTSLDYLPISFKDSDLLEILEYTGTGGGRRRASSSSFSSISPSSDDPQQPHSPTIEPASSATNDARASRPRFPLRKSEAYSILRNQSPHLLETLSDRAIEGLIYNISRDWASGLMQNVIDDVLGSDYRGLQQFSTGLHSGLEQHHHLPSGLFGARPGTERRMRALKAILLAGSRKDFVQNAEKLVDIFQLFVSDFQSLQNSSSSSSSASPDKEEEGQEGKPRYYLPVNFPIGEARRIAKLITTMGSPELAPTLNSLRAHLDGEHDFPSGKEGARMIAYYLQPNVNDLEAALDVVRMLRDSGSLTSETMAQVQSESREWLDWAEGLVVNAKKEDRTREGGIKGDEDSHADQEAKKQDDGWEDETLQRMAVEITLRDLCFKCLLLDNPIRSGAREALQELFRQLREADHAVLTKAGGDNCQSVFEQELQSEASHRIALDNLSLLLSHQMAKGSVEALKAGLTTVEKCSPHLSGHLSDAQIDGFCELALRSKDRVGMASEFLLRVTDSRAYLSHGIEERRRISSNLAATTLGSWDPIPTPIDTEKRWPMIKADVLLDILEDLASKRRNDVIKHLLFQFGLFPVTTKRDRPLQIDTYLNDLQKQRILKVFVSMGLKREVKATYLRWIKVDPAKVVEEVKAKMEVSSASERMLEMRSTVLGDGLRRAFFQPDNIASSSSCMLKVVGLFSKPITHQQAQQDASGGERYQQQRESARQDLDFARLVVQNFVRSRSVKSLSHYDLTSLASAYFKLKDRERAFDMLGHILFRREIPDAVDLGVLFGGLVEMDEKKAVRMYLSSLGDPSKQHREPEWSELETGTSQTKATIIQPRPEIFAMLISACIRKGRLNLVHLLLQEAEARGLKEEVSINAFLPLLKLVQAKESPDVLVGKVKKLLGNGWKPDTFILNWLTDHVLTNSFPFDVSYPYSLVSSGAKEQEGQEGKKGDDEQGQGSTKDTVAAASATRTPLPDKFSLELKRLEEIHAKPMSKNQVMKLKRTSLRAASTLIDFNFRINDHVNLPLANRLTRCLKWDAGSLTTNASVGELKLERIRGSCVNLVDRLILALRWSRRVEHSDYYSEIKGFEEEEGEEEEKGRGNKDRIKEIGEGSRRPNRLGMALYKNLILTHLLLKNDAGAVEVALWMRQETKSNPFLRSSPEGEGKEEEINKSERLVGSILRVLRKEERSIKGGGGGGGTKRNVTNKKAPSKTTTKVARLDWVMDRLTEKVETRKTKIWWDRPL